MSDKPRDQMTIDDWVEHYRDVGEYVALQVIAQNAKEGAELLGARKFAVEENNRRHMEPIRSAARARGIAWLALFVSAGALGWNVWLSTQPRGKTEVELIPQSQPLRVYLSNGSAPESVPSPKSPEAEPQTPASE